VTVSSGGSSGYSPAGSDHDDTSSGGDSALLEELSADLVNVDDSD
jgi:hypothetical protein